MYSLSFPFVVVDNFLDQPNEYVKFANTLQYKYDEEGRWPGKRSVGNLSSTHPFLINDIIKKIFSLFYDFKTNDIDWISFSGFQKINSKYNRGWVHKDYSTLTSIIYFCDSGFGTSLCRANNVETFKGILNYDKKIESYKNPNNVKDYINFLEENNSQFVPHINVDSAFNRMICFESSQYHCANNFIQTVDNYDRLTLIIFINNIGLKSLNLKYPIQRSKL